MADTVKELGVDLSRVKLEREDPDVWLSKAILNHRARKFRKAASAAAIAQALYLRIGVAEEDGPELSPEAIRRWDEPVLCGQCRAPIEPLKGEGQWRHVEGDGNVGPWAHAAFPVAPDCGCPHEKLPSGSVGTIHGPACKWKMGGSP